MVGIFELVIEEAGGFATAESFLDILSNDEMGGYV